MPLPLDLHFSTPRLLIRPVTAGDLPALLAVNGDPQVTQFLPYATWQGLDDAQAWLARMQGIVASGAAVQLVLALPSDAPPEGPAGLAIGTLLLFKHDEASARAELGYALGRVHWGQGLMAEALRGLCAHAFGPLGLRRLEAEVNPANGPSVSLLQRVGFVLEGTARQRWVGRAGAYDTHLFGLLASDPRPAA